LVPSRSKKVPKKVENLKKKMDVLFPLTHGVPSIINHHHLSFGLSAPSHKDGSSLITRTSSCPLF
jgi:hypothetical protein